MRCSPFSSSASPPAPFPSFRLLESVREFVRQTLRIRVQFRRCAIGGLGRSAPSPPTPLPQGARGAEEDGVSRRENSHCPLQAFLPSPLAGEGPGVRGPSAKRPQLVILISSPKNCQAFRT